MNEIKNLREAIKRLLDAIQKVKDWGELDHLDTMKDGGAEFDEAVKNAYKVLAASKKTDALMFREGCDQYIHESNPDVNPGSFRDCDGDGHYLCHTCKEWTGKKT